MSIPDHVLAKRKEVKAAISDYVLGKKTISLWIKGRRINDCALDRLVMRLIPTDWVDSRNIRKSIKRWRSKHFQELLLKVNLEMTVILMAHDYHLAIAPPSIQLLNDLNTLRCRVDESAARVLEALGASKPAHGNFMKLVIFETARVMVCTDEKLNRETLSMHVSKLLKFTDLNNPPAAVTVRKFIDNHPELPKRLAQLGFPSKAKIANDPQA